MINSKKIKTLIIDDEEPARNLIKTFLQVDNQFEIIGEASDGLSAVKEINNLKPDLVFLDIQMPKLTGFEVLELIENHPVIIFSTAFDNFAVKAFELNAIDYLLKPYSRERFLSAIQKVKDKFSKDINNNDEIQKIKKLNDYTKNEIQTIDRLTIKKNTKIQIITCDEIVYFEADDDFILFYTEKEKFIKDITMKYLEEHLDSNTFIRIHRSFIVNINYIDKIEQFEKESYYVLLKNNSKIKASKSGYKILKEKLGI